jgi:hypothetical protein
LGNTFNLSNPAARYLRVNLNYNSVNQGVHIIEFEAYGTLSSNSIASKTSLELIKSTPEDLPVISPENYTVSIYPNPVVDGDQIKLIIEMPKKNSALIEVFTLEGRVILSKEFNLTAGMNEIEIPNNQISTGMFIVRANVQGEIITKKVYIK